jgi:hypothetical protein
MATMRRRSFDDRLLDLVRKDEARADLGRRHAASAPAFNAPRMDMVARALAVPMPRRRAVGLISGALLAGGAWRPGRARAAAQTCGGDTPVACDHPKGARVCAPVGYNCCAAPGCALACKPWQSCAGGGSCNDTAKMCSGAGGGLPITQKRPTFCSIKGTASTICTDYKPVEVTFGWCCRAGEKCDTSESGPGRGCICPGEVCGSDLCCQKGEVCDSEFGFLGFDYRCVKGCPDRKKPCLGTCCTGDLVCTSNGCACPAGSVATVKGTCVPKKEDPGNPPPWQPILNMLNMGAQTSAGHGGSSSRALIARPAQSGSAAIDAALTAIAAVNGQGAAAYLAFGEGKRDPAFRRKTGVARVTPPTVTAGAGLDAASAAALTKLLAAEAKAYALVAASAKALWRSRAAHAKGQRAFAKSQLRASAKYAGQAASALNRLPVLRAGAAHALAAGAVAEVTPTADQVTAFLATLKSTGIPTYLRAPLAALGVGSPDLKHLRAGLLDQTVSSLLGPALIAPLTDPGQAKAMRQNASELSKFAKRARQHPISK